MTKAEDHKLLTQMMEDLQSLDKIAMLKEEDNVIRSVLRGKNKKDILKDLNQRHPYEKITKYDLDNFLVLYKDVLYSEKADIEKGYVRRLLKSKEGLTNELADLAIKAKYMTEKYDKDGDNTNAVSALRAASDIFMKFAKVEGLATDQPEVNVNMQMDKIVSDVTSKDSDFKKSVLKVLNDEKTVDAQIVEEDTDE